MAYFDTTKTDQLDLFTKINEGQDKKVLKYIKRWDNYASPNFSAKTVFKLINENEMPMLMTSVRRSINTLKRAGYIEPTGKRVMGLYGRKELQYRLVN